jgi:hypothetical protein
MGDAGATGGAPAGDRPAGGNVADAAAGEPFGTAPARIAAAAGPPLGCGVAAGRACGSGQATGGGAGEIGSPRPNWPGAGGTRRKIGIESGILWAAGVTAGDSQPAG